jgi:hypothetical protein
LRYVRAVIAILISGWLLLGYYGLKTTAEDRAHGWQIYQLPSHPVRLMTVYLAVGLALPFLSASLMRPQQTEGVAESGVLWHRYSFRLILSFGCAVLTALILAFLTMALMDAGVI